jgi:hypothetical protein
MAAFRLICDVEMHGDWRFTDNMNLLFGDPDETGTGLILKFSDPDLLRDFARQLNTHLGLNNDAAAKAVVSFAPSVLEDERQAEQRLEAVAEAVAEDELTSSFADCSFDPMTFQTPVKQVIPKKSPFSEDSTTSMNSACEIMESQGVWTDY